MMKDEVFNKETEIKMKKEEKQHQLEAQEFISFSLGFLLSKSRNEWEGISLQRVAEIIKKNFDLTEVRALVKELSK